MIGTITVNEAAERIGVSHKTVRRMLHNGELKGSLVGNGRGIWRISEEHVDALCEMKYYHCGKAMMFNGFTNSWICVKCGMEVGE